MVMIEIEKGGFASSANIEHPDLWVIEIGSGRFAPLDNRVIMIVR